MQLPCPLLQAALQRVKTVCQSAKMPYGLFTVETSIARAERDAGATLIAHCTDALHLCRAAQAALLQMRETNLG